jgi:hypothetical protein
MDKRTIQIRWQPHRHPSRHDKPKPSPGRRRPSSHVAKKTLRAAKAPAPRTNPNTKEAPTEPPAHQPRLHSQVLHPLALIVTTQKERFREVDKKNDTEEASFRPNSRDIFTLPHKNEEIFSHYHTKMQRISQSCRSSIGPTDHRNGKHELCDALDGNLHGKSFMPVLWYPVCIDS